MTAALWCVRCEHPAPTGACPQCGCPETTDVRPEGDWGDPDEPRRHGQPMKLLEDVQISESSTEGARILTDREVSDLRAVRAVGTSRQLLTLVETIVRQHAEEGS